MSSRRSLLAGTGSVATAAIAGCLDASASEVSPGTDADTDWPMPDYDVHATAYAPDAVAPRSSPTERFSLETASPTDRPVVADGVVYLPTMAGLLALDATDGTERWTYAPRRKALTSSRLLRSTTGRCTSPEMAPASSPSTPKPATSRGPSRPRRR